MEKVKTFWNEMTRYFSEVWIEVRPYKGRVAWPNFDTVKLSTKVVIISSIGLGLFIGVLDILFGEILKIIVSGGNF